MLLLLRMSRIDVVLDGGVRYSAAVMTRRGRAASSLFSSKGKYSTESTHGTASSSSCCPLALAK